jgi:WD40 repeat protein
MAGSATPPTQPQHAGRPVKPFRGLAYYTEADTEFFFGRTVEREIIAAHLHTARLTLLYAESGVGKSSLLRAGVAADLRQAAVRNIGELGSPRFVPVVFSAWKDDPIAGLTAEVLRVRSSYTKETAVLDADRNAGDLEPCGLAPAISEVADGLDATFAVILDQFEEIFGYQEHPEHFADELARCINSRDVRAHFLIAIREDAYGRIGDLFAGRITDVYSNYLHLEYLRRDEALEAIYGPVDAYNRLHGGEPIEIGDGLAEAVVDEVRRGNLTLGSGRQESATGTRPAFSQGDEIEAPFLQLVMDRLWEREFERASQAQSNGDGLPRTLSKRTLEELGGAEKIVRDHLDRALAGLSPRERQTANDIFSRLVTPSGVKIAHTASDLAEMTKQPERAVEEVLKKLDANRIVRGLNAAPGTADERYELFHDRLARPILAWRNQIENDRLANEKRAAEEEATRQRNDAARARRVARIAWSLAALCILALIGAVLLWQYANDQKKTAQNEATTSAALAIASEAQLDRTTRPDVSLLLSLAAYRIRPSGPTASAMTASLVAFRRTGALAILHGNIDTVNGVAFSPDGRTLASVGGDGTVRFWDVRNAREIGAPLVSSQTDGVVGMAFSTDGRTLATAGGFDPTVRLWDVRTHTPIGRPWQVDLSNGYAYNVAFSPDGRTLATAGQYNTIGLWDVRTHRELTPRIGCHCTTTACGCKKVTSVAFSRTGILATGGYDNTVRLWALGQKPHLLARLAGHTGTIYSVSFSPDGRTLASSATDGTVRLWDVNAHRALGRPFAGHAGAVISATFSPDGQGLASAGADGTVRRWSIQRHQNVATLAGHVGTVLGVAFSPDGHMLASAGVDGSIRLWPALQPPAFGAPLTAGAGAVNTVAIGHAGSTIAFGGSDGAIRLWNAQTRREIGEPFSAHGGQIFSIALSPDGTTLASASQDGNVRLWDLRTRVVLATLGRETGRASVAFSPNGATLATTGGSGAVTLWDVRTRRELAILRGHGGVESVAFNRDGSLLATADDDHTVRIWDTRSHALLGVLRGTKGPVTSVAFSPDGLTLASGGADKSVRIWDVQNHAQLARLTGSTGAIYAVAFSPDGGTLVSGGGDKTVRLWDPKAGVELGPPLTAHGNRVNSVTFTPDGQELVSASDDSTVRVWGGIFWSQLDDLERKVCALTGTGLAPAEWAQDAIGIPYHESCPTS